MGTATMFITMTLMDTALRATLTMPRVLCTSSITTTMWAMEMGSVVLPTMVWEELLLGSVRLCQMLVF